MSPPCNIEDLEALVRGDLPAEQARRVTVHAASCPQCKGELLWLRTEQDLMARRVQRQAALSPALWHGLSHQLAQRPQRLPWAARPRAWLSAAAAVMVLGGAYSLAHVHGFRSHGPHGLRLHITMDSSPPVIARAAVNGPIVLHLETVSADVDVEASASNQATVTVSDGDIQKVELVSRGDGRIAVEFDGLPHLRTGQVHIEVPPGSQVEVATASGDVKLNGALSALRVKSASGEVEVNDTTPGPVDVQVQTTSGDVAVNEAAPVPHAALQTVSGELSFKGACGKDCQVAAHSVSGDIRLALGEPSSFALTYTTQSGDFDDGMNLVLAEQGKRRIVGRAGEGLGSVNCATVSGDLSISRP